MSKLRILAVFAALFWPVFLCPLLHSDEDLYQLPQLSKEVPVPAKERLVLADVFVRGDATRSPVVTPAAEQALIASLPADFRDACRRMMKPWGEQSIGTERWNARLLQWNRDADRVFLIVAFRCSSSNSNNDGYYDERPAVLTLEQSAARLRLIPLAEPCDNCADLYHVEFSQQFSVSGGTLIELASSSSNDSPAVGVVDSCAVGRLHYVLLPEGAPVLAIISRNNSVSHDDVEGDATFHCEAKLDYRRDSSGRLTEIVPDRACPAGITDKAPQAFRYRWNPSRRTFDSRPL